MDNFTINPTEDTPKISFSKNDCLYTIAGKSYPENPSEFYFPVYKQLEQHIESADKLTIETDLEYINSSSVKMIFAILNLINKRHANNPSGTYNIIWKYSTSDTIMENKGKEFKEFLDTPLQLVSK